jgi:hypothetical protein
MLRLPTNGQTTATISAAGLYRDYEEQAQQKVQELHERLKSKTYRALPVGAGMDSARAVGRFTAWKAAYRDRSVYARRAMPKMRQGAGISLPNQIA